MRRAWTDKENDFLRKAYNNEPISKIAKALMRSEQSIRNHVHILRKKGFAFDRVKDRAIINAEKNFFTNEKWICLLYTSPSPRD